MTNIKKLAFAALLGATALGYSLGAQADQSTAGTASSGGGLSAQSSSGRSDGSFDASGQALGTTNNVRANGSTSEGSFDKASTSKSDTLNTSDSSSTDAIPANGAKSNANTQPVAATGTAEPATTTTVVSFNDLQSNQITSIQTSLRSQGFTLSSDGIWGPKSAAALRDFQERSGLPATGELNSATVSALDLGDVVVIENRTDARVMSDGNSTSEGGIDGPDTSGRLNGNSSTTSSDNGSGPGY